MLAGEGAIAIWNGISDAGRAEFYKWHLHEHMPERVGIPGFLRGRRYRAADTVTKPEFFTLYETQTFEVTLGSDYLNRLNAPTAWTRSATSHFQTTSRALTRVVATFGVGCGGVLLTLRFDLAEDKDGEVDKLRHGLMDLANQAEITGAHLLRADDEASSMRSKESEGRSDIELPPRWAILVEACSLGALELAIESLSESAVLRGAAVGKYIHEYTRLKTAWATG
jgi:hypothetical protein